MSGSCVRARFGRSMDSQSGPLIVLAEYYGSGGTRSYLLQLLRFYRDRVADVIVIGSDTRADVEIAGILSEQGWSYQSRNDLLPGQGWRNRTRNSDLSVWSPEGYFLEKAAVTEFARTVQALGVVVSAGTPGAMLGSASVDLPSLYILHTYPHGRRQKFLGRSLMRGYARNVDRFVAVSEFQRNEMIGLWGLGSRQSDIDVVANTAGPILPVEPEASASRPLVLTASWLEPYKDPYSWLQIARTVTDRLGAGAPTFVWLGEGSLLHQMRQECSAGRVDAAVVFEGHIRNVDPWYRQADIYLQTSSVENMSLSTIDSLRYGVPAVVTNAGGLPEIVAHGETGYVVPPSDPDAAAERIIQLLEDEDARQRMAEAARERYSLLFSPIRWEKQMQDVHDQVFTGRWRKC